MSHTLDALATIEHGTVAGYRAGCHGSPISCGGTVSCAEVYRRYQGDYGFRKRLNAGEDAAAIYAAELAEVEAIRARDKAANRKAKQDGATAAANRERRQRSARPPGRLPVAPEALEVVRRMFGEGKTIAETAAAAGISTATVSRARQQLGLARTHRQIIDRGEVVRLNKEGWSDTRIATHLGVSNSTISLIRRKLNLTVNRVVAAPIGTSAREHRATLIGELHAEGKTDGEIGVALGISRTAAYQARRRLGLPLIPEPRHARSPRTPRETPDHTSELTRLHGDGMTDAQIASALGLSRNYVATLRRALNLDAHRPPAWRKTPDQLAGHGTNASYARGCRCEPCKEANRAYHRDYMARRRAAGAHEHHGTAYGYQLGCRGRGCPQTPSCTDALLADERARRRNAGIPAAPEKVEADPIRKHVRALMASGLSLHTVAERAGVSRSGVKTLLYGRSGDRKGEVQAQVDAANAASLLALQVP